jgi:hypothetical protein
MAARSGKVANDAADRVKHSLRPESIADRGIQRRRLKAIPRWAQAYNVSTAVTRR